MTLKLNPTSNLLKFQLIYMTGLKKSFFLCLPTGSVSLASLNCQVGASECQMKSNLKNRIVFLAELMK